MKFKHSGDFSALNSKEELHFRMHPYRINKPRKWVEKENHFLLQKKKNGEFLFSMYLFLFDKFLMLRKFSSQKGDILD